MRRARRRRPAAVALALAAALWAPGCAACPPDWAARLPATDEALYASGHCGEVFVEAEARSIALTRAARRLADCLGLDVEERLSVVALDGRLFVEARGQGGASRAFDGLELVDEARCQGTLWVLVRLPRRG